MHVTLCEILISATVGALIGATASYFGGVMQALKLDELRRKQDEKSAVLIISSELSRIIAWHNYLTDYKDADKPFEIWGMFLPTNSFWQYLTTIKNIFEQKDLEMIEEAYLSFSTYDRQMQQVIQAWSLSARTTPPDTAKRWHNVYWDSILSDTTMKLVKELKEIIVKIEDKIY